jgi:hypothetical protein
MVRKVKRAEGVKIEQPYTCSLDTTLEQLIELMGEKGVHSILGISHTLIHPSNQPSIHPSIHPSFIPTPKYAISLNDCVANISHILHF